MDILDDSQIVEITGNYILIQNFISFSFTTKTSQHFNIIIRLW